ncbi:MAG TPA: Swt1 family HEPN domain-containing protein [Gemmatimonadales bacterium]|nr:Swt1 family HEPN domain-containing protein [Gemmatimonadales bacterium]
MARASKATKGFTALRQALLEQTKWSPFALSRRVRAVKQRLPMKTKVAQAIVAHGEGLRPDRYLGGADLQEVQQTMAKLGGAPASANGPRPKRAKGPVTRVINFKALGIQTSDPFLDKGKLDEAVEMSKSYPVLYVLENSIRTVIKGVMEAKYGPDWWNKELTSAKASQLKNKVDDRLKKEEQQSWHQRRGAHQIDYVDLTDLLVIAQSKRDVFFDRLLGDEKWFESLVSETSPSRNVLCHMNPLADHSVTALGVRLTQWHNHLKAREAEIRAAMTPAT